MSTVLFACLENAGRSQMAALFNALADATKARAISPRTAPTASPSLCRASATVASRLRELDRSVTASDEAQESVQQRKRPTCTHCEPAVPELAAIEHRGNGLKHDRDLEQARAG
jgi:arsenate reductase (thioredoxin)